jgi:hypothetical protein
VPAKKRHDLVFNNATVFQACYTVSLPLSAVMFRYRWTCEVFCFKCLFLSYLRKYICSLTHSSFLRLPLPFKLLEALRSRTWLLL